MDRPPLRELLRAGHLAVTVRVDGGAEVTLTGRARIGVDVRRGPVAARLLPIFKRESVRFRAAGERKVTLALTRQGRRVLRHLRRIRLVLAAEAIDADGQTARSRITLNLQR